MTSFFHRSMAIAALSAALATGAAAQDLASFAVLGGSTVTNTGSSVINGNLGVSPGGAITGFPPGLVTAPYTIYADNAVAANAQSELTTAYNVLAGRQATQNLTGQDLGGLTLVAGVYAFDAAAQLTGNLTLDAQGNPNAVFIFNIGSTLDTAAASQVLLINGANANNVFFRVGSSATLLAGTVFQGKIIALTSISLLNAASINCGAALARNGAVTLINNSIGICPMVAGTIGGGTDTTGGTVTGTTVGNAIDAVIAAGGTPPIGFQVLGVLSPDELDAALRQLAGETATGAVYSTGQAMDAFLEALSSRRAPGDRALPQAAAPAPQTVTAMGYAAPPPAPGSEAFAEFEAKARGIDVSRWSIWGGSYGSYGVARGDAADGTADRMSAAYGLAFGFERTVTADTMFGLAISSGGTNFDLDDSLGSGHSAMLQAAAYGRAESDTGYVSAALAYGVHDMHTERYVSFAGGDRFTAQFYTHDIAGQIEAGYHLGWLTPYAGLRAQYISIPGYSESTAGGASTFALDYAAHRQIAARTEIGARADWAADLEHGALGLHARAAWAHSLASDRTLTASFVDLPGASFAVAGAEPSADALLLSLGTDMVLDSGLSLGLSVDGSLSRSAQSYAGSAHLGYRW